MKNIESLLSEAMRVDALLDFSERYLAHLPHEVSGKPLRMKPETLGEHMELVLQSAEQICKMNGLFSVIERLIDKTASELGFSDLDQAIANIKEIFINTIVFHDFGKVNEHFQVDRMKNGDPFFKGRFPQLFSPKHGHSELGAYIFLVYHLEKYNQFNNSEEEENDNVKLSALTILFSNSILLHHSPNLLQPTERVSKSQFLKCWKQLKKYLKLYKDFPEADITIEYFENLKVIFEQFEQKSSEFALFALLRLNFSLLTAADYLATGRYTYGLTLEDEKDWGVLSEEQRHRIIWAAENEKIYNKEAYHLFRQGAYQFQNPQEQNENNLNLLRKEMSVMVLQELNTHKDKRLFYLEAPTGGGKTNLSMLAVTEMLRANPELNKVFYVFPFTTLITQTHKSIKETLRLEDKEIALLHSKVGFQTKSEVESGESEEEREDGLYGNRRLDFLQNLFALYPIMLVTHVRFFDILKSNGKEESYLMHRLANSIVVLDELQSYNPKHWDKMMYMLDQYGKYFNIRFILMSATLPRLDNIQAVRDAAKIDGTEIPEVVDLLPNPRQYFVNPNFKGRVRFNFELMRDKGEITEEELAKLVIEKSRERAYRTSSEGRVFTIVEFIFKKTATAFKEEIKKLEPFFDHIFVLSGTILESRRRQIIYFLKQNRKTRGMKVLLITTQVVEAGVDIDMDLGFKNISLIDSDEQLAGRVNRNVGKEDCEVYLFRLNKPDILYGKDLRYKITRELPVDFHQNILESKDFTVLYERVFTEIDKRNESPLFENFKDNYLGHLKKLNFPKIHREFQLIEQDSLSVFVPIQLPVKIENENGEMEDFFSKFELKFLEESRVFSQEDIYVDGAEVWALYRRIMESPDDDFIAKKIERKAIQGILAKFTFSIFNAEKTRNSLAEFSNPELGFENYFYLSEHQRVYDIESGLMESKFNDPENFIL